MLTIYREHPTLYTYPDLLVNNILYALVYVN